MNLRFRLSNPTLGEVTIDSPKGWEDLTVKVTRDPEYHGLGLEFPVALQFHCKAGRKYIMDAYNQLGIDGEVTVYIDRCCGNRGKSLDSEDYSDDYSDDYGSSFTDLSGCTWKPFVNGIIQMKDIKRDPVYLAAPIIQSSDYQKFKNRIDNQVDLQKAETLDGNEVSLINPIEFTLHNKGIVLVSKADIPVELEFVEYGAAGFTEPTLVHTPPLIFTDDNYVETAFDIGINTGDDAWMLPSVYVNETPYVVTMKVEFRLKCEIQSGNCAGIDPHSLQRLVISKYTDPSNFVTNQIILDGADICQGGSRFRDVFYSQTLTFVPGEHFKIWRSSAIPGVNISAGAVHPFYIYDKEVSYFRIRGELPFPATTTEAFGLHEAGALISQRVLGKDNAFYSETFGRKDSLPIAYDENGCDSFGVTFTGLQARKFPDSHLIMSLKEFYTDYNPVHNLGMGIDLINGESVVRCEKKKHFYSDEVLFRLKNVPNITTYLMQDYFMSEARFGYDKWETEEVSGIDEFNTKRYYNTGIKAVDNIIEKLSTVITSGYSIELTRRKQWKDDNTNEDYKNDNERFYVCTKRTVDGSGNPTEMDKAEKAENYTGITGIYSPETCYNLRVSPERNKLRHNGIIAPALLKYPGRVLRFTYGEGNYKASYRGTDDCDVFNNVQLAGNDDVAWDNPNQTEDAIWNPLVDEFTFALSVSQIEAMMANPKKLIQYGKDEEEILEGWILDAEPILMTGSTKFKLLRK